MGSVETVNEVKLIWWKIGPQTGISLEPWAARCLVDSALALWDASELQNGADRRRVSLGGRLEAKTLGNLLHG
jgi:hypothetical protein